MAYHTILREGVVICFVFISNGGDRGVIRSSLIFRDWMSSYKFFGRLNMYFADCAMDVRR